MSDQPVQPETSPALAIAGLILSVVGLFLGLCVFGGALSAVGIVLCLIYLRRPGRHHAAARVGVVVGVFGLCIAALVLYRGAGIFREITGGGSGEFAEWHGKAAPDFTVTTLAGETVTLSSLRGRRVIIDFWATWCPPCVAEIPHFITLRKELSADAVYLIGISQEDTATLQAFVKSKGINYPIAALDRALPSPYADVTGIPTTFFIDAAGNIETVLVGYHNLAALRGHATAQ
jgi:peroxiredoxin